MLDYFGKACKHLKREQQFKVWQVGYHAEHIYSYSFINKKIEYIHNNPVKEKIVSFPEDYYFSSARNYAGLENELLNFSSRFILMLIVGKDCKSEVTGSNSPLIID